jgi:hypothetical protein
MAENRGGYRPTAPQNNPANVSATGGAGQSGTQPARYMSGLAYGQGQAQMNQQTAAPMAGNPVANVASAARPELPQVIGLTDPSMRPEEPITSGIDMGPGPGSEALIFPAMVPEQPSETIQIIKALYQQDPRNEDLRFLIESLPQAGQ